MLVDGYGGGRPLIVGIVVAEGLDCVGNRIEALIHPEMSCLGWRYVMRAILQNPALSAAKHTFAVVVA